MELWVSATERGMLSIAPGASVQGVAIETPIGVGVLPGIELEDVLYHAKNFAAGGETLVPAENWFAGLVRGGDGMVACAWPGEGQRLNLLQGDETAFRGIKFALNGQPVYLEMLAAPAIWRREPVKLDYLEKTVRLDWQRPFPATYKTQFVLRSETDAPRNFEFLNRRNEQWRPEVGSVVWPVWFEGDAACMLLSKKTPPRDDAIIYPFKGGGDTLLGFVERTPVGQMILERNEHAPLPRGPRDARNVGFVACGGTQIMRGTILALSLQKREKEFLREYADFLSDYVAIVQQRHEAFFEVIADLRKRITEWLAVEGQTPEVRMYLEDMLERANEAGEQLQQKMDLWGGDSPKAHMANASRAADRMKELLDTEGPELFPEIDEIVHIQNRLAWGHAESGGMRFSMATRAWAQAAALGCTEAPGALVYAVAIRAALLEGLNGAPPW